MSETEEAALLNTKPTIPHRFIQALSTLPEILPTAGSVTSPVTLTATSETLPDMSKTEVHVTPLETKTATSSNVLFRTTEAAQKSPTSESTPFQGLVTFEEPDAITAVTENVIDTVTTKAQHEGLSTRVQTTASTAELMTVSVSGTAVDTLKTTQLIAETNIGTTPSFSPVSSSLMQSSDTLLETLTTVDTGPLTKIPTSDEQVLLTEMLTPTEHVASEETSRMTSPTSADISTTDERVTSPETVSEILIESDSVTAVEATTPTKNINEKSSTKTAQLLTSTVIGSATVISTEHHSSARGFSSEISKAISKTFPDKIGRASCRERVCQNV